MPKNYNVTAVARRDGAIGSFSTYRTTMTAAYNPEYPHHLRHAAIDAVRADGFEVHHIISVTEQSV